MTPFKSWPFSLAIVLNALGAILCTLPVSLSIIPQAGQWWAVIATGSDILLRFEFGSVLGLSASSLYLGYYTFQLMLMSRFQRITPEHGLLRVYLGLITSSAALAIGLYLIYVLKTQPGRPGFVFHLLNAINAVLFIIHIVRFIQVHLPAVLFGVKMRLLGTDGGASILVAFLVAINVTFTANLLETKSLLALEMQRFDKNIALIASQNDDPANRLPDIQVKKSEGSIRRGYILPLYQ